MTLTPRKYFRFSLFIPFTIPLVTVLFGFNLISGVLVMSLFYGGLPYIFFALCLFFGMDRMKTVTSIRALSYATPLLFIPFLSMFWFLPLYLFGQTSSNGISILNTLSVFVTYILIIGYFYVLLVNIVFSILVRKGMITEETLS